MTFSLETERLLLRWMTSDDAADLAERRSDPLVAQYQSWIAPYSLAQAQSLIETVTAHDEPVIGEWAQPVIVRREDGQTVGDLAVRIGEDGHSAEIGYTLHRWAWGNGYATEAAAALVDYLIRDRHVHRVTAMTDPGNSASQRLLERLGFTHEGTLRESFTKGEETHDDMVFGLLDREWRGPSGGDA